MPRDESEERGRRTAVRDCGWIDERIGGHWMEDGYRSGAKLTVMRVIISRASLVSFFLNDATPVCLHRIRAGGDSPHDSRWGCPVYSQCLLLIIKLA